MTVSKNIINKLKIGTGYDNEKKDYNKLYRLIFKKFSNESQISSYKEFRNFIKEMKSTKPKVNKEMKAEKKLQNFMR